MVNSVGSDLPRLVTYIEPELLEKVKKLAKRQRRSTSALVCYLLERAVEKAENEGEI